MNSLKNKVRSYAKDIVNGLYDAMPWFILSITVLSSSLASSAIQKLLEKFVFGISASLKTEEISPNILYIAIFTISIFCLYKLRRHLFKARTQGMVNIDSPEQREHLILFLSNIQERKLNDYTKQLIPNGLGLENDGLQSLEVDLALIDAHKKNTHSFWPWEMALRAIQHHVGTVESPTLRSITIICSPESIKQLPQFSEIVQNYIKDANITLKVLAKKNSIHYWGTWNTNKVNKLLKGYDFEDFDGLTSALHWYIKQRRNNKVKEKEMVIDFTGGMKVTSVVAATLTFNSNIKAQYISTITSQVKGYDVIYGTSNLPNIN